MAELHERLQGRLNDPMLKGSSVGNLGMCYYLTGQVQKAITCHEQALVIDREIGNQQWQWRDLGRLGSCYAALGQIARAIEYQEQALAIDREIGDPGGEAVYLGNLGNRYADLGADRPRYRVLRAGVGYRP